MGFFSFKWLLILVAAILGFNLFGCQSLMPDKGFDVVNGLASQAREGLQSGTSQWQASFQGVNPGVTVEAGLKYYATAYYSGVGGQFSAGAAGQLSPLAADALEHVRAVESDTSLNTAQKNQMIADIVHVLIAKVSPAPATQPVNP